MLLPDCPDLHLQYDAELALLRVRWADGHMDNFRNCAQHLLEIGQLWQPRNFLFEMDSLPDISAHDQIWLGRHWVPKVLDLPLERVVFCISNSRVYHQVTIESLLFLVRPFIRFDVQFFGDAEPALRWLTGRSARLPELLAEWDTHQAAAPMADAKPAQPQPETSQL